MKVYLASKSKLKILALSECGVTVCPIHVYVPENPEQPFGYDCTLQCALNRLETLKKSPLVEGGRYLMAIENGIDMSNISTYYDICHVVLYDSELDLLLTSRFFSDHLKIPIPSEHIYEIIDNDAENDDYSNPLGYDETAGSLYASALSGMLGKSVPSNDWMSEVGCSRKHQIYNVVDHVLGLHPSSVIKELQDEIITIPDYPKDGVLFQDWMSLFSQPELCDLVVELMANLGHTQKVDLVLGPELRGCMLGPLVAQKMKIPFVPIRKKGKLPPPTIEFTYQKEYGTDTLELNPDQLFDKRCLIIDDVLATGGSLLACCELIKKAKGYPALSIVLNDVPELREKAKEQLGSYPYQVLMNLAEPGELKLT